jgi:hypothetical protein
MKRLAAMALLLAAFGALMHFWRTGDPSALTPPTSVNPPAGGSEPRVAAAVSPATPLPSHPTQAPASKSPPTAAERRPATPVRIEIRAPQTVRSGETFSVTIDVQAPAGIRRLAFSVTYKKSILRLVEWTAGAFVQQGGTSVQFEDVSEGSLLVRVESGVVAGAGTIAALQFQALARGASPLAIEDVSYVEDGRQETVNRPTAYEGTITVE